MTKTGSNIYGKLYWKGYEWQECEIKINVTTKMDWEPDYCPTNLFFVINFVSIYNFVIPQKTYL